MLECIFKTKNEFKLPHKFIILPAINFQNGLIADFFIEMDSPFLEDSQILQATEEKICVNILSASPTGQQRCVGKAAQTLFIKLIAKNFGSRKSG